MKVRSLIFNMSSADLDFFPRSPECVHRTPQQHRMKAQSNFPLSNSRYLYRNYSLRSTYHFPNLRLIQDDIRRKSHTELSHKLVSCDYGGQYLPIIYNNGSKNLLWKSVFKMLRTVLAACGCVPPC
jgi:hypothetical protein